MESKNKAVILPILDVNLLPDMDYTIKLNNIDNEMLNYLNDENTVNIALPLNKKVKLNEISEEDFYEIGVTFDINEVERLSDGYKIKIKAVDRVEVLSKTFNNTTILADYNIAPDIVDLTDADINKALLDMKEIIHDLSRNFTEADIYIKKIDKFSNLNKLIGYLTQFMPLSIDEKYELIKLQSIKDRSLRFLDYLIKRRESIKFQLEISQKLSEKSGKNYRETVLREQLKTINDELKSDSKNKNDYRSLIEKSDMPAEVKEAALYEVDKFETQNPSSSDYNIIRNYLELLIKLPWKTKETEDIDLKNAKEILDARHYGLDKVKKRIIQHLAVMKLKKDKKGSILLLVGPPGTGKTSLGKSIAEVLKRKYVRLSLGGVKDESEIRGHRRTYVGALPGRIIDGIKKAGEKNPVMVLDEVDKLSSSYNGDPASALLEVLDPEQNNTFTDHYLDLPYDLSDVFFIATANSLDTIPRPLLDRMEVIQISSYTATEKFHIAKDHLLPEVISEHGLTADQLKINDSMLEKIISDYTLEAGVRGLKKQLSKLARTASEKIVIDELTSFDVSLEDIKKALGRHVSSHDKAQDYNPPGVVTGLAWTQVGGEILFIEAAAMPGSGQIILTGQLGDVMKESARIALSLVKSRLPLTGFDFKEKDIHIHVPSGSVPKDGPSAGITMFTALSSLVTGKSIDSKLAMTGEISLRGAVLPIGGLKEKLIAAERAGIKKILIPNDNIEDLNEVPDEVKENLKIIPVKTIEDVLREGSDISVPKAEYLFNTDTLLSESFSLNSR
ncbi:endopeptidase La [Clostridium felsineum]|uniref:endopeptidase La n=1 Tax=Clostridium felsineum TaxID=36839 RepID=UPI00098CD559|nr:endopeptidase La [Clostridium felsineum]URZ18012.1 Lon protease 1 [Clostridium felsineum DSM 794]